MSIETFKSCSHRLASRKPGHDAGQATEPPHEKNAVPALPASSPALIEFVRNVVPSNPRVQAARSALNARGAFQAAASRPLYNPSFSIETQHAHENRHYRDYSRGSTWSTNARPVPRSRRRTALAVHADYIFTRRAVTADLLSGLAGYQTGVERDALATKRVRLMQDFASLTKKRFEAGDMARVEFNLAILVFADARMRQATVRTALIDARQQVTNLIPPDITTPWPTLEAGLPALPAQDDLESLLTALPEVQAAQRRVDSAKAVILVTEAPKVLDPTIGVTQGDEAGQPLFGVNLTLPLPFVIPSDMKSRRPTSNTGRRNRRSTTSYGAPAPASSTRSSATGSPTAPGGIGSASGRSRRSATGRPSPSPVAIRRTRRHGIPGADQPDHRQPGQRPSTASGAVARLV